MRSSVNGFLAYRPVKNPSFSISPVSRCGAVLRSKRGRASCGTPPDRQTASRTSPPSRARAPGTRTWRRRWCRLCVVKTSIVSETAAESSPASTGNFTRVPCDLPDPVLLHRQHFVGPLAQLLDALQQIVRVLRDLEEPLLEIARRDRRAAAPASAVDDLLVGEDGLVLLAPVHRRAPAVRQPALVHLDEQPLVPLVVRRLAGGELALPGIADAQALELPFHVRDVGERRRLGMNAALDGGVLGRQAERVPAERMQHVVAAQPLRARHDVADDVVADVPDMRVTRRVREHLEAVVLRARRIFSDLERARARPAVLPFLVECLRFVVHTVVSRQSVESAVSVDSRQLGTDD